MVEKYRTFNIEEYEKFDKHKDTILLSLRSSLEKDMIIQINPNKYGTDLLIKQYGAVKYVYDVEIKRAWKSYEFLYPDFHFTSRKYKDWIKWGTKFYTIMINNEITRGILAHGDDIYQKHPPFQKCAGRPGEGQRLEKFYRLYVHEVIIFDL